MSRRSWELSDAEALERFGCVDCVPRAYGAGYMVRDDVWGAAGARPRDNLCVAHLEERLGRRLLVEDLTDAPINWEMRRVLAQIS